MTSSIFTKKDIKFILGISFAIGFVQFSLGLIVPFVSIYGKTLKYSTPTLIGLSLGIYGLTQGILQLPYGAWSDKAGRKTVLLTGLMQMILGFFAAYIAKNIYSFIFARALQGSGAIMAVAYSWIGDGIEDSKKNRAMGLAGMVVGLSSAAAFGLGPLLYKIMTVPEMFLLCALLAFIGWIYIFIFIKEDNFSHDSKLDKINYSALLKNISLIKICFCGFFADYILFSLYYIVPIQLEKSIGADSMWKVFLPAIIIAIAALKISSKYADNGYFTRVNKTAFLIAFLGSLCFFKHNIILITFGMICCMTSFMILISLLPSGVNKLFNKNIRGAANGLLNTFVFIGAFAGGSLTGTLWKINPCLPVLVLSFISFMGFYLLKDLRVN